MNFFRRTSKAAEKPAPDAVKQAAPSVLPAEVESQQLAANADTVLAGSSVSSPGSLSSPDAASAVVVVKASAGAKAQESETPAISGTRARRQATLTAAREREKMLEAAVESSSRLVLWLRNFLPPSVGTNAKEGLRMAFGVCIGILFTALISRWWGGNGHAVWMAASLGASSVLVFGMPASPLAQPWPVVVGSVVCVLVGTLCDTWIQDDALALAVAVGLSVAVMVPLRCLHPPSVGLATFVILSHQNGLDLIWFPVLFNISVLLACGVVYNVLTGRAYPHPQHSHKRGPSSGQFTDADLNAALTHYNQVLDISRADLEGLLHLAGKAAFQRTLGDLRCADVMSAPVLSVSQDVDLKEAWALMRSEQIKALPVVDAAQTVVGIISNADFINQANLEGPEGIGQRLKNLVLRKTKTKLPQKVSDLMAQPVQTARANQHVIELMPLFSADGHHHLPVVDEDSRLVGIITQTDLVRVLAATVSPKTSS